MSKINLTIDCMKWENIIVVTLWVLITIGLSYALYYGINFVSENGICRWYNHTVTDDNGNISTQRVCDFLFHGGPLFVDIGLNGFNYYMILRFFNIKYDLISIK